MLITKQRPINLNLLTIHLPVAGIMSIAHRISGFIMFAILPVLVYWFDLSLRSPVGFQQAMNFSAPWRKLAGVCLAWALAHHFLAGIRYLLLDLDLGFQKPTYRWSAMIVLLGGALVMVMVAWIIR